ncbi:MAG: hypothetical protein J7L44_03275 [Candidatus Diapherotrites archaeon]|nr:hypothetical protein [Candidatus Diapherotrites archaeon]
MNGKLKKLEQIFNHFLIFSGAFLIFHVFFFRKDSVFLQISSIIDAFFGLWHWYFVGWALVVVLSIIITLFFAVVLLAVFFDRIGLKNKLIYNIFAVLGRLSSTDLVEQKVAPMLSSWLLKAFIQLLLVLCAVCLAVVLILIYGGTTAFSTSSEPYYGEYLLFISASYLIMLGAYRLGIIFKWAHS